MQKKGFTLIEIMIAVAIIGILAAIAIPAYQGYVLKAKMEKIIVPMEAIALFQDSLIVENKAPVALSAIPVKLLGPVDPATGNITDNGSVSGNVSITINAAAKTYTITGKLTNVTGELTLNQNGARTQSGKLTWSK